MDLKRPFRFLAGLLLALAACWSGGMVSMACGEEPDMKRLDVLIVAPHSDDEIIGCTSVLLRALVQKKNVGVVVVTAGDAFARGAAAAARKQPAMLEPKEFEHLAGLRQNHTLHAMRGLRVPLENVQFLGYPDGGLRQMHQADDGKTYRQPFTHRTATYGPIVRDYHSQQHGKPAPYTKAAVLADLVEILKARRPREIYVTHEVDTHGDHQAAFWFVRDAAQAAGFQGSLFTFVVHGEPPAAEPDKSITLTAEELQAKRDLLLGYQVGVSPAHDDLADTYAKPIEQFWLSSPKR
ncbi:PIG-L deacetylase family protein [Lignipirellula cremea]|uniref:GlcNAc-PI de-N-acetylase n=1 Tax=Lignipirellula cremea TaxID=2528010 RepID=A0A518DPL5_9BACT|nr:PIG-L family deacetylase [Lignipirellula cremea]QDU93753.1 GlcNAc-PI de-N-acetylase [Lignipirellula cremea]